MLLIAAVTSGGFFVNAATGDNHTLTIEAYDQNGIIRRMHTTITPGASGYTPLTFTAAEGVSYTVTVQDYQDRVFDHWADGVTSRTRTVTLTTDLKLVAYYKSGTVPTPSTHTLTIKSVNMQGNPISGLYTTIRSGNTIVRTGYTRRYARHIVHGDSRKLCK
jgi:hypothetical protein